MINKQHRWELAQSYELNWWNSKKGLVDFEFYKYYAIELKKHFSGKLTIQSDTKILEVGSGAGGILTYLPESNERYAIDPLEEFYSSVEHFAGQRDKNVKYFNAKGESIPFEQDMFDLIIMDNVLDHCEDPVKVMSEVRRVLKQNGFVYFKQNTYHLWGRFIRSLMEIFIIDKGHPHTFSKGSLLSLIHQNNFSIIFKERGGYLSTWKKEISSHSVKDKIKAVLFATRDKVTYVFN